MESRAEGLAECRNRNLWLHRRRKSVDLSNRWNRLRISALKLSATQNKAAMAQGLQYYSLWVNPAVVSLSRNQNDLE
jgi:hypothetical protein